MDRGSPPADYYRSSWKPPPYERCCTNHHDKPCPGTRVQESRKEQDSVCSNDLQISVDMDNAGRIRIMAGSSPPCVESDLVNSAFKYIHFLKRLHATGVTLQDPTVDAVDRYINYWLPLVDQHGSDKVLFPPTDIAWLWHCHRLAPDRYETYCHIRFGRILECQEPFDFVEEQTVRNSDPRTLSKDYWSGSSIIEDLVSCTKRHRNFLWHIAKPAYQDKTFLREGVSQYTKFVALSSIADTSSSFRYSSLPQSNTTFGSCRPLIPTHQIALMWQTHILMGIEQYNHDCKVFRGGSALVHDNSVYDRSFDNTPNWCYCMNDSRRRWNTVYGETYGDLDADNPPPEYYCASWKPRTGANRTTSPINHATVNGPPWTETSTTQYKKPSSPIIHSTFKESPLTETIPILNKKPKKRYQIMAESLIRTRHHKVQCEKRPTTNHTQNHKESPTRPKPKKRYQVFLERRERKQDTGPNEGRVGAVCRRMSSR